MSEKQPVDWSQLPKDLLQTISQHLKIYSDYIRLRAVCRTWRSFLPPFPPHQLPVQLPWLLLNAPYFTFTGGRAFYDVSTRRGYYMHHLPQASYPRSIVGSSHGFLIITGDSPTIFCYNPITRITAFLPPLSTLPAVIAFKIKDKGLEYLIRDPSLAVQYNRGYRSICFKYLAKVILSDSPTKDTCVAMAIIKHIQTTELAYCKCGDKTWKPWSCQDFNPVDVIYSESENLFYVVNQLGDVAYFSTIDNVSIRKNNVDTFKSEYKYLVKFKNELLLLCKQSGLEKLFNIVPECHVYRFREVGEGMVQWDPVTDLGDLMLFIGLNTSSLGLLASDFAGCRGNCIYFADDHARTSHAGVYDLSNGHIEDLPSCFGDWTWVLPSLRPWEPQPPIWFTPNPTKFPTKFLG